MKRNDRPIFIGDKYKWMGIDEKVITKGLVSAPSSRTVNRGEICEITQLKMVNGVLFVRAKNLRNNKNIMLLFNANGNRTPYNKDGSWLLFDSFFKKSDFEIDSEKYNL